MACQHVEMTTLGGTNVAIAFLAPDPFSVRKVVAEMLETILGIIAGPIAIICSEGKKYTLFEPFQRVYTIENSITQTVGARKIVSATPGAQKPEVMRDPHTKTGVENHEQLKHEYVLPPQTDSLIPFTLWYE